MDKRKYLVGLQFDTHWLQLGVYATDQMTAGDIAEREFKINRPPFVTSIIYRGDSLDELSPYSKVFNTPGDSWTM